MSPFTVRCVEVRKSGKARVWRPTRMDTLLRGQPSRRQTSQGPELGSPLVKARASGPLSWVTLLGCFLSASLFIISITLGDGMSLIATLLLSGLSTLIGISNKWELQLPRRPRNPLTDAGDVVVRYPNGSYLIVKCTEEVARELYFAPEEIVYNIENETIYRMISLVGTLMLMLGVIFLANAKLQLQFCWGGAYIILNAAHWVAAAVPQRLHWDLSCYEIEEQGVVSGPKNETFTDALFQAILFTKSKSWVRIGKEAAPKTVTWDKWLEEAERTVQNLELRKGAVKQPLWPTPGPDRSGQVWDIPHDWTARGAWQRLDDEAHGRGDAPVQPRRAYTTVDDVEQGP